MVSNMSLMPSLTYVEIIHEDAGDEGKFFNGEKNCKICFKKALNQY